jgi:WD40 repeat protein
MKHPPEVSAAFSSDGSGWSRRLATRPATQCGARTARLWDAATGKPVGEPMQHDNAVWCATFSSDGQQVLTATG